MLSVLLSLIGGILLWLSQPPRHQPWLQLPGLTALIVAVSQSSPIPAALNGLLFGIAYVIPQLLELRLPLAISALLFGSQTIVWTLFALVTSRYSQQSPIAFMLSVAYLGTALMWLEWSIMPLWGTAQNFARGWSSVPKCVQFVAFTGVAGLDWLLFFFASLFTELFKTPTQWLPLTALGAVIALLLGLTNTLIWNRLENAPTLRVAAFGWAGTTTDASVAINSQLVKEAALQGAKLLVTPEAAVQVENRDAFRDTLQALAGQNKIALAIGYFDTKRNENCIDFIDAHGAIRGRYVKTHLVPLFENYQRGKGELSQIQVEGFNLGGLICQDDNFADIAGKYGRSPAQFLAIPTHDWAAVKEFHFANSRWRALEFRLGIVRAASQGISAIVSPRGQILAKCDHFTEGAKLIVADLPLPAAEPTTYALTRDVLPLGSALFVLLRFFIP